MKKLELEDYSIIKPYLDMANYEGYNSNFVTMMMWNHEYHIQYEIHEHFLVMLHNYKGWQFWAMPFTTPEYYKEAIDYMISYSQNHHFDFMIDCAIEDFVKKMKPLYQDQFIFERTPYNDDYIYDKNMLKTLSGKKMQKRRNHYNAFVKKYPHYVYKDLDLTEDFDTILMCLNKWKAEKDTLSESMTSEVKGIMYLLSTKHLLDFEVGGIFIEGKMEAFIIASRLNHSTIQIHVEKANKNIRGLYPAILKEILEHHFESELYVNREEDMGLENLRKSKLSLHPIKMIHKYRIFLKNLNIRLANEEDTQRIEELWLESFQDETEESKNYYFQNLYQSQYTYVLTQNQKIISALQIVPMSISKSRKIHQSYFILGVCTDRSYQKQGCMKALLNHVLTKYQKYDIYLQAYVPEIYRPYGFVASHYHFVIHVDKSVLRGESIFPIQEYDLLKKYYEIYTQNFDLFRIRDDHYWQLLVKRCQAFHDHILIFSDLGYFIYHETEDEIYISEFIYLSKDAILNLLSYFKDSNKEIILECDLKVDIKGEKQKVLTMMSQQFSQDIEEESFFINEVY